MRAAGSGLARSACVSVHASSTGKRPRATRWRRAAAAAACAAGEPPASAWRTQVVARVVVHDGEGHRRDAAGLFALVAEAGAERLDRVAREPGEGRGGVAAQAPGGQGLGRVEGRAVEHVGHDAGGAPGGEARDVAGVGVAGAHLLEVALVVARGAAPPIGLEVDEVELLRDGLRHVGRHAQRRRRAGATASQATTIAARMPRASGDAAPRDPARGPRHPGQGRDRDRRGAAEVLAQGRGRGGGPPPRRRGSSRCRRRCGRSASRPAATRGSPAPSRGARPARSGRRRR